MNRFDPNAVEAPSTPSSDPRIATAEHRFRLIRRIKARVRAERARGLTVEQIRANTMAIQDQELATRLEGIRASWRELNAIALRATADALGETVRPTAAAAAAPAPSPFDRWLAETIHSNRSFVPMKVLPGQVAPRKATGKPAG